MTQFLRLMARFAGLLVAGTAALAAATAARADGTAVLLELQGPLGVATAEYIIDGIEEASAGGASLIIIRMDTPGGLVEPMRDIVRAILGSHVPVVTYVSPGGARADSAGTYILLASHVAAMAPTTHLGAATPVSLTGDDAGKAPERPGPAAPGEQPDGDEAPDPDAPAGDGPKPGTAMERKVMNDAVAYIRGLAEAHGRNAEWAERAVRDAATLTAAEALDQNVIDLIATDEAELLSQLNGREVKVNNELVTLDTEGLVIENVDPGWRTRFLSTIANPQIALLLMLVGIYGLIFEGYNPGAVLPGVVGVVCLLLAAYALQVIPVNFAGLALIVVGIILIVAEAFVPSFGALGLGGIAAFIFGSIIMFDSGVPGFGISPTFVVVFGLVTGLALLWLTGYVVKLRRRGPVSGEGSIVGGVGVAMETFERSGRVWLEGEAWQAETSAPVQKGQQVRVTGLAGLTLHVTPAAAADAAAPRVPT